MYPADIFRHTVSRFVAMLRRHGVREIVRRMAVADRAELDCLAGLLGLGDLLAEVLSEPDEISG